MDLQKEEYTSALQKIEKLGTKKEISESLLGYFYYLIFS